MLTARLSFDDVRNAINNSIIKRIDEAKHGSRSHKRIIQGDLEKVTVLRKFKKPKARKIRRYKL